MEEVKIDYDKIINGVYEKMNTKKEDNQEPKTTDVDVEKLNKDYFNKAIEFENKFNNKSKEYDELYAKNKELSNKVAEQEKQLQEYAVFGKSPEQIAESKIKIKSADRNINGLRKL